MPRILLLVAALIVYGSLYPWDFRPRTLNMNVPELLLGSWPRINRFLFRDTFINVLIYIPLGATAFLSYRRRCGPAAGSALAVLTGILLSTAIELAQIYARPRTPSAYDILCNGIGTVVGVWLGSAAQRYQGRIESLKLSGKRADAASGLLLLWVVSQLYPLFPNFSLYRLAARLRQLRHPHWAWPDVFTEFAAWIAVAVLVRAVARKHGRAAYLLLVLLVPARLLVGGPGPTAAHFLGAAAALAVAMACWPLMTPRVGAGLLIAAICVRELLPFHVAGRAQPFVWIPFGATLGSDWIAALGIFLRKSLDYGMAIWMLWRSGAGWPGATGLVAALLAAGEAAQIWLPGRTPEITDPLLAMLMAFVLRTLQRERVTR